MTWPICIAHPFVEGDHTEKRIQVEDLAKELIRQVVEHRLSALTWVVRTKVQTRRTSLAPPHAVKEQVGGALDHVSRNTDYTRWGDWQFQAPKERVGQEFVRQHTAVLRVVLELHNVVVPVRSEHELGARPSLHGPEVPHGFNRRRIRTIRQRTKQAQTRCLVYWSDDVAVEHFVLLSTTYVRLSGTFCHTLRDRREGERTSLLGNRWMKRGPRPAGPATPFACDRAARVKQFETPGMGI